MTQRHARSILLVDWPSRDVPDSLAGAGWLVMAEEGPATYAAYELVGGEVERRVVDEPASVDAVYVYRPLDELPEIVQLARRLDARSLWWETGPEPVGEADAARAREIVEGAGLEFRVGRPPESAS